MKKTLSSILLLSALVSSAAHAGSGKAIVAHWGASVSQFNYVFMSNISNNPLDVTVTYYQHDGTLLSDSSKVFHNFTNNDATIAASNTAHIQLKPPAWTRGYAVIEWKNQGTDDDTVGLVAHSWRAMASGENTFSIPVNNGQPF
ncbi:MAG: hypothetical protein ACI8WB_003236 [Phenylobacterium sp.]|jgi:hypothetical protein